MLNGDNVSRIPALRRPSITIIYNKTPSNTSPPRRYLLLSTMQPLPRVQHYHTSWLYDDRPFGTSSYRRQLPHTPALRRPPITTIIIQQSSTSNHVAAHIDDDDPYYICKFFYSSLRYPLLHNYRNANYYHNILGGDCAAVICIIAIMAPYNDLWRLILSLALQRLSFSNVSLT